MDPWFAEQTAGIIGGVIGASIGTIWGGIGGPLAGVLAPKGKAKPLVVGLFIAGIVIGLGLAATAIVALASEQPWYVVYTFGLSGLLLAGLTGALLPVVLKRYREAEQRALAANELRRS